MSLYLGQDYARYATANAKQIEYIQNTNESIGGKYEEHVHEDNGTEPTDDVTEQTDDRRFT